MLNHYDWQPGNGTRYDLYYGPAGKRTFVSWMRFGGAGGISMVFDSYLHYTYMMEKMQINISDAVGILKFLEEMGHDVGYPEPGVVYEQPMGEPFVRVLE